MKILIDIPKEFECDYNNDRFEEFFERVKCDIPYFASKQLVPSCEIMMAGNYEKETLYMLEKAFKESEIQK